MLEKIRSFFVSLEEKNLRKDLMTAIKQNDLPKIKRILGKRDSHGDLKVNLNGHFRTSYNAWVDEYRPSAEPIFSWLSSSETTNKVQRTGNDGAEINLQVVLALLDAKDANGLRAIDLSKENDYGDTDFSRLLRLAREDSDSSKIQPSIRIELLKKLFENPEVIEQHSYLIKNSLKGMIVSLSPRNFKDEWPVLEQFLNLSAGHIHLNDGTLLDLMLEEPKIVQKNRILPGNENSERKKRQKEMREICEKSMRAMGYLRMEEIPEDKRFTKKIVNKEVAIQKQFENDAQGTHDSGVTASIAGSLIKLKTRYSLDEESTKIYLKQIEAFLSQLPDNNPNRANALKCFHRIKDKTSTFSKIDVSLRDALALIWQGILDKESIPEKNVNFKSYINLRKESLIERLSEAETAYPNRPKGHQFACDSGTLHKLVEVLNHAHCDVEVVSISSVRQVASEDAIPYAMKLLASKPLDEQRAIWMNWDEAEGVANDFRKYAAAEYDKHLKLVYDPLLTEQQRQDIIVNFEDLPLKHLAVKELEALIEQIKAITEKDEQNPLRQKSIGRLKEQVDSVLPTENFADRYLKIKSFYSDFVKREKFNDYLDTKQEEIKEKNKSVLYKIHTVWAGMFAPSQNANRKVEVGIQVMENLNCGKAYDDGLDENAKEITTQTGSFGVALKCR